MNAERSASQLLEALDAETLETVVAHIRQWYPSEACGLVFASSEGRPIVECCDNLADKYHRLDPEMYPRTGADAFVLNPMSIVKGEEAGHRLSAIWHSHVRVGAYFSAEDVDQALVDDEPRYPGVDHVVFDAQDEGVLGYKVFRWTAGRRFDEVASVVFPTPKGGR